MKSPQMNISQERNWKIYKRAEMLFKMMCGLFFMAKKSKLSTYIDFQSISISDNRNIDPIVSSPRKMY